MTEAPTSVALRLDTPPWAETSERDDEALIHTSSIGVVPDLDGHPLSVEVVQRDELVFTATTTTVQRAEPYIRVSGQRMDAAGARLLAKTPVDREQPHGTGAADRTRRHTDVVAIGPFRFTTRARPALFRMFRYSFGHA